MVEVGTGIVAVHERRQRHVEDDIGVEGDDLVDVIGRGDTEVGDAGELPDVATDLVGIVDEQSDDLHVGSARHGRDRCPPDVPAPPLHDPDRHADNVGASG